MSALKRRPISEATARAKSQGPGQKLKSPGKSKIHRRAAASRPTLRTMRPSVEWGIRNVWLPTPSASSGQALRTMNPSVEWGIRSESISDSFLKQGSRSFIAPHPTGDEPVRRMGHPMSLFWFGGFDLRWGSALVGAAVRDLLRARSVPAQLLHHVLLIAGVLGGDLLRVEGSGQNVLDQLFP